MVNNSGTNVNLQEPIDANNQKNATRKNSFTSMRLLEFHHNKYIFSSMLMPTNRMIIRIPKIKNYYERKEVKEHKLTNFVDSFTSHIWRNGGS